MKRIISDIYLHEERNYVALYDAITMDLQYFDLSISKSGIEEAAIKMNSNNSTIRNKLIERIKAERPNWHTLYLFLNDTCNMRCRYCRYMNEMPFDKKMEEMGKHDAFFLIDRLLDEPEEEIKKTLVLFGTEILLSKSLMKEIVKYFRNKSQVAEISIFTNGTLIDNNTVQFFKNHKVKVIVSIDGDEIIHNQQRVFRNGNGTFKKISNNIKLLNEANVNIGLSVTVAPHNIDYLPETIEYLFNHFRPINIGLNPLEINEHYEKEVFFHKYIENSMKAFDKARQLGISIPQIMHRIRPFVERKVRYKDCPSCGNSIRAFQNGDFGTCSHFVIDGKYRLNVKKNKDFRFNNNEMINLWNSRTQFNFDGCEDCFAKGICGGGCVRNAYKITGDIMQPDDRICYHSKYAVKWLIRDLYELLLSKGFNIEAFKPQKKHRQLIYGKIKENQTLPLYYYSINGEMSL